MDETMDSQSVQVGKHATNMDLQCKICEKQFPTRRKYKQHRRNVHVQRSKCFDCVFCKIKFERTGDLGRHTLRHIEERPFSCGTCPREFCLKKGRDNHEIICRKPKVIKVPKPKAIKVPKQKPLKTSKHLECSYCDRKFYWQHKLDSHLNRHMFPKPYSCIFCGTQFEHEFRERNHVLCHIEEKPLACNLCGRSFCSKSEINNHMRLYHPNNVIHFQCDLCLPSTKFISIENLNRHKIKKHSSISTGQQGRKSVLNCQFCEKIFSEKGQLQNHLLMHIHETPYNCDVCGKSLRTENSLSSHLNTHTMEKPHKCLICGRGYTRPFSLRAHVQRIHEQSTLKFDCVFCDQKLFCNGEHRYHTLAHIKEKPYHCEICGKECADKHRLTSHLRVHTREKCIPCEICGKKFHQDSSMRQHKLEHFCERKSTSDYKCPICRFRFKTKKAIEEHLRTLHKNDFGKLIATRANELTNVIN